MIKINLTEAEAKVVASWTKNIIKGLTTKHQEYPIIKKKAEIILMEAEQKRKQQPKRLMDVLNQLEDESMEEQARTFLKQYDKEVAKIEGEINAFKAMEEQIKTQVLNDNRT